MAISVLGNTWIAKQIDEDYASELQRKLQVSDFLAKILSIKTKDLSTAYNFLDPKVKHLLPDPFHLLDMEQAVDRVVLALQTKEKICIFADYDVDGATSSSLLKRVFRDLGNDADIYVPDRIAEGYGPSKYGFSKIKENGSSLVITVDCGSLAHEQISYAKSLGLDVIVIDHHISSDILPDAVAVVNPNRVDESSEYRYLAAVGVCFLFAAALVSKLKTLNISVEKINLLNLLDLVALGTVCDVMPLIGLNRAFVSQGLKIMAKRGNTGIRSLFDIAYLNEKPKSYHLGFVLGPRINAGGRVGKSNLGARILSSNCDIETNLLARELDLHNNERKVIESLMLEEAIQIAETQKNDSFLFVVGQNWHPGVIGIIAGRLKELYNKPVAVVCVNDGIAKASCRSINGLDFGAKILDAKNHGIINIGGGHAMAAGFTADEPELPRLKTFLNDSFAKDLSKLDRVKTLEYICDLIASSINLDLVNELEKLEPYGQGNSEPIFKISDLFVLKADVISEKHVKCMLAPVRSSISAKALSGICFNSADNKVGMALLAKKSSEISVIASIKLNEWQGRQNIQLQIKDVII